MKFHSHFMHVLCDLVKICCRSLTQNRTGLWWISWMYTMGKSCPTLRHKMGFSVQYSNFFPIRDRRTTLFYTTKFHKIAVWKAVFLLQMSTGLHLASAVKPYDVLSVHNSFVGLDDSTGIATRYGLHGTGIESRKGRDFLHPSRSALGPTQPPI
jgi:hypothetical protein